MCVSGHNTLLPASYGMIHCCLHHMEWYIVACICYNTLLHALCGMVPCCLHLMAWYIIACIICYNTLLPALSSMIHCCHVIIHCCLHHMAWYIVACIIWHNALLPASFQIPVKWFTLSWVWSHRSLRSSWLGSTQRSLFVWKNCE